MVSFLVGSVNESFPHRHAPHHLHHHHLPSGLQNERTTSYWTMHFDTNPSVLKQLSQKMREDPRVLR